MSRAFLTICALFLGANSVFAQTNPTARSLPVTENFGTTTFTAMPTGFAAWSGLAGDSVTTQALAEASAPNANFTITARTTTTATGGFYGYAVSSNARPYIQTSGNATAGVCQMAMALNCTGLESVVIGYDVEVLLAAATRTVGVVCQYRVGTSGSWTTLTPTSGSNPYSQAGGTTGFKTTVAATLPPAANNQPVVQVRWAIWRGTEGGTSSGIGIDNVTASGTADGTAPTISTYTPANGASGVSATTNLVAQFSETIAKGTGEITVKLVSDNSTVFTIPVTDSAVAVGGSTATITLPSSLAGLTAYYVNIAPGAFKDGGNNNFAGITDTTTWTFTTATTDSTPPAITALSPADDSSTAFPNGLLAVTYGENIIAGTGSIVIKTLVGDTEVESIPVSDARVVISGATATINPNAVLQYGTGYYVEIAGGAFKDSANNGTTAVTGSSTWNFTTRPLPQVVISQYYEGTTTGDRYIELKNLTNSPLSLAGYRLVAWSDTAPSDNEGWKSGTNTSLRVTDLTGNTIPANGSYLIAEPGATTPAYAANNTDLITTPGPNGSATSFNGDDSVVLYNGAGFTQNEVVDAMSFTAAHGTDISIYRTSDTLQGFDFVTGTSYLNFTGTWATRILADVNSATYAQDWYLRASQPPKVLTLSIAPPSFSEGAGASAAIATVSVVGPVASDLFITAASSDTTEATVPLPGTIFIPMGQSSVNFSVAAVNDAYLDGNKSATITVTATNYTPDSKVVTVEDELTDINLPVVINEVDADQAATDSQEFIELYNNSASTVSLDGVVVVLYNGGVDLSYKTIDLTGKTIGPNDYFVIGSATVPNVDQVEFTTNGIENGADAVALYLGNPTEFPINTPVATTNGTRVDAVVYDTNDADDSGLLTALLPAGKPQIDEGATSAVSEVNSVSRLPNGGAAFDTTLYVSQGSSPGLTNILAPPNTYDNWIKGFYPNVVDQVPGNIGFNADPDGDGVKNGVEALIGGDPKNTPNTFTHTELTKSGNLFTFVYTRATSPPIGVTAAYEWSTDLTNWQNSGQSFGGVGVTIGDEYWDDATATTDGYKVTATTTGSPAQLFVRVVAHSN